MNGETLTTAKDFHGNENTAGNRHKDWKDIVCHIVEETKATPEGSPSKNTLRFNKLILYEISVNVVCWNSVYWYNRLSFSKAKEAKIVIQRTIAIRATKQTATLALRAGRVVRKARARSGRTHSLQLKQNKTVVGDRPRGRVRVDRAI